MVGHDYRRDAKHYATARRQMSRRLQQDSTNADTDAWLLPLVPEDRVNPPRTSVERRTARILTAVADEETDLLDEELLELLAASQK